MTANPVPQSLFKRKADSHKGSYGHLLVIAGSRGMTGAPVLSAESALRSGAGLVSLAVPETVYPVIARKVSSEIMVHPLPDTGRGILSGASLKSAGPLLKRATVLAVGPGLSQASGAQRLVRLLLSTAAQPVVLDADGVVALAGSKKIKRPQGAGPLILTPHPGEMGKLLGLSAGAIQKQRQEAAVGVARTLGAVVLLKGHQTVVASAAGKVYLNETGNPGMASAGMGDVLTGLIAALVGQGCEPFTAAKAGAYLHGLAGDIAVKKVGQISLTAGDVLDALPAAFRQAGGE